MTKPGPQPLRCAIYTRVSTDHGLEQDFNSLHAQREAAEAYVKSQAHEGWRLIREGFDDGGFSGGSLDRPALQRLLASIRSTQIDIVVVYRSTGSPDPLPISPSSSSCSMPRASPSSL
jgi:site-specific DNA recombinase